MNIAKIVIIGSVVLVLLFVFLIYLGVIPGLKIGSSDGRPVDLEVWGVFDDSSAIIPLIEAFQSKNANVTITYRKKSIQNYEEELVRSFAAGKGPDIFMIHNTWAPKFRDLLSVAPQEIISLKDFRKRFVDVVQKDFTYNQQIYGLPLYVDTLALYYNIDLFNSAGLIEPPKDWSEFEKYSKLLTKETSAGDILVSGSAIGSGKNVLYSSEILSLLMLQNGSKISDPQKGEIIFEKEKTSSVSDALEFYTKFSEPDNEYYSWSQNFAGDSQDRFASGRAAMMLGYSWTRNAILQKSPRLRFDVSYIPQKKDSIIKKNYANYWGYGVYLNSPDKNAAWNFLKFLAEPQNSGFYLSGIESVASQKSLLISQQEDPKLSVFANQALTADSWLQLDNTLIESVFVSMIDQQVLSEQSAILALRKAASDINSKILSK